MGYREYYLAFTSIWFKEKKEILFTYYQKRRSFCAMENGSMLAIAQLLVKIQSLKLPIWISREDWISSIDRSYALPDD